MYAAGSNLSAVGLFGYASIVRLAKAASQRLLSKYVTPRFDAGATTAPRKAMSSSLCKNSERAIAPGLIAAVEDRINNPIYALSAHQAVHRSGAAPGVELPASRRSGTGMERGGYASGEAAALAEVKKTPKNEGNPSASWTRAD